MDIKTRNSLLLRGQIEEKNLFPSLAKLAAKTFFQWEFGLSELPESPGIIIVRGPRQYGKSTWLEYQLKQTIKQFGARSAFYLNGDYIADISQLEKEILALCGLFNKDARVKRIFIDEITAIHGWQKCLKRMADAGELEDVLLITTGSKARDLYRDGERLPGRKGKLKRNTYLFTQISYASFSNKAKDILKEFTLPAYLISGGSPLACADILTDGMISENTFETVRDWVYGECALEGRSRASLIRVVEQLLLRGGTPIAQTQLASESGLANNTVAQGYLEFLQDMLILGVSEPRDVQNKRKIARKASKYPFVNLFAANVWFSGRASTPEEWVKLAPAMKGVWFEWCVASELYRRAAIHGSEFPMHFSFWQSKEHEIDFVADSSWDSDYWIEVKSGNVSHFDFSWFKQSFPKQELRIVGIENFKSGAFSVQSLDSFLLEES